MIPIEWAGKDMASLIRAAASERRLPLLVAHPIRRKGFKGGQTDRALSGLPTMLRSERAFTIRFTVVA